MKNKLYLGSGIWCNHGWYNHYTSKSIWYNNLTKIKSSKNIGELKNMNDFKYDIDHDLTEMKPIQLLDNSLLTVYTSHMIEHLTNQQVQFLFDDVYRMLSNDGVFRITCPDIDLLYNELIENNNNNLNIGTYTHMIPSAYEKFIHQISTYFAKWWILKDKELVDSNIYNEFLNLKKINEKEFKNLILKYGKYGVFEYLRLDSEKYFDKFKYHLTGLHINWFNKHKIINFLINSGFKKIFIRKQNESILEDYKSSIFDYNSPQLSLYIEAIK